MKSQDINFFSEIFFFWQKRHFTVKFSKFCSESSHRFTALRSNFVKFGRRDIGEIVRYLRKTKKKFRLPLKLSLLRG